MAEPVFKIRRPTKSKGKKKRYAPDETFEKQVDSSKKQKTVHHTFAQPAIDTNTLKMNKKKRVKKQKTRKEKKVVVQRPVMELRNEESPDKEEEPKIVALESEDSSDEDVTNRSVAPAPAPGKKKVESSDDSDEEEQPEPSSKKPSAVPISEKHNQEPKKPVEAETKNVILKKKYEPRSSLPPPPGGSKLVYMGNLSPSICESDVVEFFKDAGKVDWVRFTKAEDRFLGFGHVRFDTSEAAQKALKRKGEELMGRAVELILSDERSIFDLFTPSSKHKFLFMGNLSPSVKEDDIIEFFKDAGKVVSVYLIMEGGHFLGYGNVEFASSTVAYKAVRRYGHMLLGRRVELVLATERTVWFSYTPSSGMRRHRVLRGPRRGITKNELHCKCTLPESGVNRIDLVAEAVSD